MRGGLRGWRGFWRRWQRRMGWRGRRRRSDIRFLEAPKSGVLFPGVAVPSEPLPGAGLGNDPLAAGRNAGAGRAATLQALVEAMGVRPADPREGEAYLRAWLELTSRQKQVVCLVCAGRTNLEIAQRLRISPNTVKGHITLALGRFGLRSRAELRVALAGWDFSQWKPD